MAILLFIKNIIKYEILKYGRYEMIDMVDMVESKYEI